MFCAFRPIVISLTLVATAALAGDVMVTVAGGGADPGNGIPATNALLYFPYGVTTDAAGNLYIADSQNVRLCKVDAATGLIQTLAGTGVGSSDGDGGPASAASLAWPVAVAVNAAGDIFIADASRVRRIAAATGTIETYAGGEVFGFDGDGGPAAAAQVSDVGGLAFDPAGNLLLADYSNGRVRKVDAATGIITTIAGTGNTTFSGDGGPATAAGLAPRAIALDAAGNIFVADSPNCRVRRIDAATGAITTLAGTGEQASTGDGGPATAAALYQPEGVAVDAAGNVIILDTGVNVIRKVNPAGVITTVACNGADGFLGEGRPALLGSVAFPAGIALDPAGNILIADTSNHRIRKVGPGLVPAAPLDTDADGFMDYVETAAQTAPADPASTPFNGAPADAFWWFSCSKLSIKLNFTTSGKDSVSISGTFDVPEGVTPAGQRLIVDVGGVVGAFTLDERGSSTPRSVSNKAKLTIRSGVGKFTASLKNGAFSGALANDHMREQNVRSAPVVVPVAIFFNNTVFTASEYMTYTAKVGRSGTAKRDADLVLGPVIQTR